jgi:hypothetical protein
VCVASHDTKRTHPESDMILKRVFGWHINGKLALIQGAAEKRAIMKQIQTLHLPSYSVSINYKNNNR